jgi:hypothetical protein
MSGSSFLMDLYEDLVHPAKYAFITISCEYARLPYGYLTSLAVPTTQLMDVGRIKSQIEASFSNSIKR